jgi:hypothetical protein
VADDFDMPEQAPVEPTPEAPPVEEPPQEAAEFVPYRRSDGTELQLPFAESETLAKALGYENAAALVNQLRNGEEAQGIYREAREYYRRANRTPRAEPEYQEPQRQQPRYQPPPQQYRQPADEDPLALLRETREQTALLAQQFQAWQESQQQQAAAQWQERASNLVEEADREYQKFASELKAKGIPDWKIPERDRLLDEADEMGMFQSKLSVAEIYKRIHKMNYADDYANAKVQQTMERQREAKAKVPVAGARPAPQAPPSQADQTINELPMSNLVEILKASAREVR